MELHKKSLYLEDLNYITTRRLPWEDLNGSRILITGATGLIGSVIVDSLMFRNQLYSSKISISALSRNEKYGNSRFHHHRNSPLFSFITHDINNPLPENGDYDYIIHAASNTHPVVYASDPIGTITTNVIGTYNILNYAAKHNTKRFVFLSTVEIYGENTGDAEKFDELSMGYIDCNTLRAGYPESKRTCEALCNAFIYNYRLDVVIPRLCRIYGPSMFDDDSKVISQFIKNAISGNDIILKSHGDQFYSFCFSTDAVSAIMYIMMLGETGVAYNVSDSRSDITLKELAGEVAAISGVQVKYEPPDEVESTGYSKVTKALLDSTRLNELGWTAQDSIQSGLTKTLSLLRGDK